ncbi:MAG: hypothetical protein ABIJ18_04490 [archaeon]
MKRILVVEPMPEYARALERYIEMQGCIVDTAYSGESALLKLQDRRYSAVFTRANLFAEIDGIDVAETAKRHGARAFFHSFRKSLEDNVNPMERFNYCKIE